MCQGIFVLEVLEQGQVVCCYSLLNISPIVGGIPKWCCECWSHLWQGMVFLAGKIWQALQSVHPGGFFLNRNYFFSIEFNHKFYCTMVFPSGVFHQSPVTYKYRAATDVAFNICSNVRARDVWCFCLSLASTWCLLSWQYVSLLCWESFHIETDNFESCLWLRLWKGLLFVDTCLFSIAVSVHIVRLDLSHS